MGMLVFQQKARDFRFFGFSCHFQQRIDVFRCNQPPLGKEADFVQTALLGIVPKGSEKMLFQILPRDFL